MSCYPDSSYMDIRSAFVPSPSCSVFWFRVNVARRKATTLLTAGAGRVLRTSREMTSKRRGKERGLTCREGFDTTPHRSFDDVSEGPWLAPCVNDSCARIANGMPTW